MLAVNLKLSSLIVIFCLVFNNVSVYAGGGKDANGLKSSDYDKNGWAYKNGEWVAAPTGTAVYKEVSVEDILQNEVNDNDIIQVNNDEIDINGLKPSDYDQNGWALKNDEWVASPNGAVYILADENISDQNGDGEKPKMSTGKKVLIGIGAVALAAAAAYVGYKGVQ